MLLLEAGLNTIAKAVSTETISTINASITAWGEAKTLSQTTSVDNFRDEAFTQTGSEIWDQFIRAAYALGKAELVVYPAEGDQCLLCHQPLTTEARGLLLRVWEYLQSEAQEKLDQTEKELQKYVNNLRNLDFGILDDQTVSYRHLSADKPELLAKIMAFIKACEIRRNGITQAIINHQTYPTVELPDSSLGLVSSLIETLQAEKELLENKKVEEEIRELEKEKHELEHRRLLSKHLDGILKFVSDAKWIKQANAPKVRRSTKHITKKYNDLFEQLISQEYVHLFEDTLTKLKCPLGVKIATHGSKGETWKQIALKREDELIISGTSPDQVLSEGNNAQWL